LFAEKFADVAAFGESAGALGHDGGPAWFGGVHAMLFEVGGHESIVGLDEFAEFVVGAVAFAVPDGVEGETQLGFPFFVGPTKAECSGSWRASRTSWGWLRMAPIMQMPRPTDSAAMAMVCMTRAVSTMATTAASVMPKSDSVSCMSLQSLSLCMSAQQARKAAD